MKVTAKIFIVCLAVAVGWVVFEHRVDVAPKPSSESKVMTPVPVLEPQLATPAPAVVPPVFEPTQKIPATCEAWEIIPTVCVGSVTARLTESDLTAIFGKETIKNEEIHLAETEYTYGTRVFADDEDKALNIVWTNRAHEQIAKVLVLGKKWRTKSGIGIGTKLTEIEKINGKPFTMVGFRFDGEGSITGWNDGALQAEGNYLELAFKDPGFADGMLTKQERDSLTGDKYFPSSNPVLQKTNPYIDYVAIVWNQYDYAQTK
jgi:hypothetical protein